MNSRDELSSGERDIGSDLSIRPKLHRVNLEETQTQKQGQVPPEEVPPEEVPPEEIFLKKGTNKAQGKYIYPEPTQTKTGNCAAYAGASCLWAMGLDHCPKLIPSAQGGSADAQFQYKISKIVERLTDLIYTKDKSVATGLKEYIKEKSCADSLEVDEFSAGGKKMRPNGKNQDSFDFAISELKRCQDVIPFISWKKPNEKGKARHAITLVGIDDDKKEVIAANPWGKPRNTPHVPPDDAGKKTEQGKKGGHTRYKYTKAADGTVTLEFEGHKAQIYHYVTVCPKDTNAKADSSGGKPHTPPPGSAPPIRYDYSVQNIHLPQINGFAIILEGLQPLDIGRIYSPPGWTAQFWFEGQETRFAVPAPDMKVDITRPPRFLGIIWRTESEKLKPGGRELVFSFEVRQPRFLTAAHIREVVDMTHAQTPQLQKCFEDLLELLEKAESWCDDDGDGIVLDETSEGTYASCVTVRVPKPCCDVPALIDRYLKGMQMTR